MNSPHELSVRATKPELVDSNISVEELTQLMLDAGVAVEEYGKSEAKDIDDLQKEIAEGECFVIIGPEGVLTREVRPVFVNVLCHLSDGRVMVLREEKQVFRDGRIRKRNLSSSLGEKLKAGEDTTEATFRALSEEIEVTEVVSLEKVSEESRTFTPPTFPGIKSTYSSTFFVAIIPESAYVAEGYVERQLKKDNYYVWDQQARR